MGQNNGKPNESLIVIYETVFMTYSVEDAIKKLQELEFSKIIQCNNINNVPDKAYEKILNTDNVYDFFCYFLFTKIKKYY